MSTNNTISTFEGWDPQAYTGPLKQVTAAATASCVIATNAVAQPLCARMIPTKSELAGDAREASVAFAVNHTAAKCSQVANQQIDRSFETPQSWGSRLFSYGAVKK